ncbi:hypothetical protein [Streptomyces flavofungini]|uniref:hypothetical protein n=1 Tax=Streptomyces flavofungini TaxID=68200 RepID=UPI0034E03D19
MYETARALAQRDLLDYLKENGADIFVELAAEQIKECWDDPDIPTCLWAIVTNLPWAKAAKLVTKLPKISKAVWGINDFLSKSTKARKLVDKGEKLVEQIRRTIPKCLAKKAKDRKSGFSRKSSMRMAGDKGKGDDDCPAVTISIYRTPKMADKNYELANGPNRAAHTGGDGAIYVGEYSVAKEYVGSGSGPFADGMIRYEMSPEFMVKFAEFAERYDWQGPNGSPRIEFVIPVDRLKEFNDLTVKREWLKGKKR